MKGTDDFLRIIHNLPDRYHGMIVGVGQDEHILKQQALHWGIEDRVTFTGAVHEPCRAYHAMDAFVFTSHFEHFGLVILEAAACGLPIYTLNVKGGVNEVLQNIKVYKIHTRSPVTLANLIIATEDDKRKSTDNHENRKLINRLYNWKTSVEKLLYEYQHLFKINSII